MAVVLLTLIIVSAYCVAQIVRDVQRGDRLMAGLGLVVVTALWLTPLSSRAVLLEFEPPASRG
jgi:hypothetical protein